MRSLNCPASVAALSLHVPETVATATAMKAAASKRRGNGMPVRVGASGALFRFMAASVLAADASEALVVVPSDAPAAGRYIRELGPALLELPFTFATADAAILLTVPVGFLLVVDDLYWKVTTPFTGGTSSAIGISSSNVSGGTTKGDLLGGAAGDVAATLVAGTFPGTIGPAIDTVAERRRLLKAGDTIRFDRITSAFTAGVGAALVKCTVIQSPAAA